jgi:hypothetical protein
VRGQGCSDAGFCTIHSFKPGGTDTVSMAKSQIKVGLSYGGADHSISVEGVYLEYDRKVTDRFGMNAKISSLSQRGNGIAESGLSDVYFNINYEISRKTQLTAGVKIPLADGNQKKDGLALPMDYQASLGTYDLILGLGYYIKDLQVVVALQQPVSRNKNECIDESYPVNSELRKFQSTNDFKRSGDVLLRASYPVKIGDKCSITPSLLPIYHLMNDSYTTVYGVEREIEGSQGLTLNGNAYFDYAINQRNALQLNLGAPFIVRDARPDGLTRSFVVNLEYRVSF